MIIAVGGVNIEKGIFFVVYIGHNGLTRQIYYAELTPIKLRMYLADGKVQKSKSIKLKKFPMDPNEKSLEDKDWRYISYLVTAFVDKKLVEHLRNDLPPIITMNISQLKFIVCLQKIEGKEGVYNIFDFFKTEMSLVYENEAGEKLPISQYAILQADDLLKADNIRYDVLLPSF